MGCGPVDWWGGSSQNQNSKTNGLSFLNFFDLSDQYWDFCKKQFLGTSWMGWGPVEWVGDQLTGWSKLLRYNWRWNFLSTIEIVEVIEVIVEVVEVIIEVVEIIVEVKFQWIKVPKNDINNILEKGFEIKIEPGWESARWGHRWGVYLHHWGRWGSWDHRKGQVPMDKSPQKWYK